MTEKDRKQKEAKLQFEIDSSRDNILEAAQEIKNHAERIREEMDKVSKYADSVIGDVENSKHFSVDPWNESSWRCLPNDITKLDTLIKSRRSIMRVYNLTASLSLDKFDK